MSGKTTIGHLCQSRSPSVAGGAFQETKVRKVLVKQIIRTHGVGSS